MTIKSHHFNGGREYGHLVIIAPKDKYCDVIGEAGWTYNPPQDMLAYDPDAVNLDDAERRQAVTTNFPTRWRAMCRKKNAHHHLANGTEQRKRTNATDPPNLAAHKPQACPSSSTRQRPDTTRARRRGMRAKRAMPLPSAGAQVIHQNKKSTNFKIIN